MNSIDNMIVTPDQIDYVDCNLVIGGGGISGISSAIPLENVSGAIDKFQEETDARKKDIADLKRSLFVTHSDLLETITKNHEEATKEIHEIKKTLVSYMIITLFLTVGFIYCILSL
jgi:hypothetical protein